MDEVLGYIKTSFDMEISNKIDVTDNEIVVYFADGTKARIATKKVV